MAEVRFDNITKKFGKVSAVSGFTLTIREGEFITLLGPSGCGKTTTLRLLAGFCPPTAGKIEIAGTVVSDIDKNIFIPPGKRKIGMVFQDYALWPHMNVFSNVAYPLKISGVHPSEQRRRVKEILSIVRMSGYEERFPHELSGGQQQRIAVARALVSNPSVLLLDEPLSNLDASLRESMRVEIKNIHTRLGVTILFVTHDQAEAMSMSDRIVVMNEGTIHQIGTPEALYDTPEDEFVASFVGKANFFKVVRSNGDLYLHDDRGDFALRPVPDQVIGEPVKGLGCVKPTDVQLTDDLSQGINGAIESSLFVGDYVVYYIKIGSLRLEVKSPERRYRTGSQVGMLFKRVILF
jgi:iron(III) transport system ATP-binding protein